MLLFNLNKRNLAQPNKLFPAYSNLKEPLILFDWTYLVITKCKATSFKLRLS